MNLLRVAATGLLGVVVVFVGCGTPGDRVPTTPLTVRTGPELPQPTVHWGVQALAESAFATRDQPAARQRHLQAARGREYEYFVALLGVLGHRPEDATTLLGEAALLAGSTGQPGVLISAVGEIAHRECCLRHSYLAASLQGLTQGWVTAGGPPAVSPQLERWLATLAQSRDEAVSAAARQLLGEVVAAAALANPPQRP